jgi:hypothetical protein
MFQYLLYLRTRTCRPKSHRTLELLHALGEDSLRSIPDCEDSYSATCLKNYLRVRTALGLHA